MFNRVYIYAKIIKCINKNSFSHAIRIISLEPGNSRYVLVKAPTTLVASWQPLECRHSDGTLHAVRSGPRPRLDAAHISKGAISSGSKVNRCEWLGW